MTKSEVTKVNLSREEATIKDYYIRRGSIGSNWKKVLRVAQTWAASVPPQNQKDEASCAGSWNSKNKQWASPKSCVEAMRSYIERLVVLIARARERAGE